MKKYMITIVAAMALCLAAHSQEVMKVELKNGQVTTFPVEDINRFYFEEKQAEQPAPNCGVSIVKELVLPLEFAVMFSYESEVEYVMYQIYSTSMLAGVSDEILAQDLLNRGRMDKSVKVFGGGGNLEEGKEYIFAYTAFNASGKHGEVYRHPIKMRVAAEEQIAEVEAQHSNDNTAFRYRTHIDDDKVLSYYVYQEIGNGILPALNNAVFGLAWREVLNDNANTEEYVYDKDIIVETPNGEQRLLIYTWCMDYDEKLYNIINGGFWALDISQTRSQTPTSANGQGFLTITKREYDELKQKIKSKTKIINVSK